MIGYAFIALPLVAAILAFINGYWVYGLIFLFLTYCFASPLLPDGDKVREEDCEIQGKLGAFAQARAQELSRNDPDYAEINKLHIEETSFRETIEIHPSASHPARLRYKE